MSILLFILVLSFLVLIHELGHYLAARARGVRVEEFGLGYPPHLLTLFHFRGTKVTLNAIPFGGFVRLEGEDGPPEWAKNNPSRSKTDRPFYAAGRWSRLLIVAAGVLVNIAFAVVAFSAIFSFKGIPVELHTPRIMVIAPDSPAQSAHLPTNVEIRSVRFEDSVTSTPDIEAAIAAISAHRGQTIDLEVTGACQERSCDETVHHYSVYVRTEAETPADQGAIGIAFESVVFVFYPWYEMPVRGTVVGVQQAIGLSRLMLDAVGQIGVELVHHRQLPSELAGPVGIVHQADQAGVFKEGWIALLNFAGVLSLNLGIINLLPIPALDGGRILFILMESVVSRRRLNKVEGYAHYAGYAFLLALIVLVTIRDISRLFGG